ncbi:hypothetical protein BDV41DRAFT_546365 [Aspergillus transmontanensis]|uniref:Uncharacterized protein n=1 Tax=Aspergillus transmontanensis TaxID=1034304 RepID=A0A5N6VMU6_9EURO|nr:hypothetical protein BDV41DRAFT_546365 [Aspergillus transmontanensis]
MALHNTPTNNDRQQQCCLIRKHGICLEGPTFPETWPDKYRSLFQLVREPDKIRYGDYKHDEMSATVRGLVQTADGLRQSWATEDMWKGTIERLVLERFEQVLEWQENCS